MLELDSHFYQYNTPFLFLSYKKDGTQPLRRYKIKQLLNKPIRIYFDSGRGLILIPIGLLETGVAKWINGW